jgi:hypothetical protein
MNSRSQRNNSDHLKTVLTSYFQQQNHNNNSNLSNTFFSSFLAKANLHIAQQNKTVLSNFESSQPKPDFSSKFKYQLVLNAEEFMKNALNDEYTKLIPNFSFLKSSALKIKLMERAWFELYILSLINSELDFQDCEINNSSIESHLALSVKKLRSLNLDEQELYYLRGIFFYNNINFLKSMTCEEADEEKKIEKLLVECQNSLLDQLKISSSDSFSSNLDKRYGQILLTFYSIKNQLNSDTIFKVLFSRLVEHKDQLLTYLKKQCERNQNLEEDNSEFIDPLDLSLSKDDEEKDSQQTVKKNVLQKDFESASSKTSQSLFNPYLSSLEFIRKNIANFNSNPHFLQATQPMMGSIQSTAGFLFNETATSQLMMPIASSSKTINSQF